MNSENQNAKPPKKYPNLTKEQREKYHERITKFMTQYYETHKEHLKNEAKKYYEDHKQQVIQRTRQNYLNKRSENTLSHLPFYNSRLQNISRIV